MTGIRKNKSTQKFPDLRYYFLYIFINCIYLTKYLNDVQGIPKYMQAILLWANKTVLHQTGLSMTDNSD